MCTLMAPSFTLARKSCGTWEQSTALFSLSPFIPVQRDMLESKTNNVLDICRHVTSLCSIGVKNVNFLPEIQPIAFSRMTSVEGPALI